MPFSPIASAWRPKSAEPWYQWTWTTGPLTACQSNRVSAYRIEVGAPRVVVPERSVTRHCAAKRVFGTR